jgi:NADH-quinone oxidoreductase subunit J
MSGFPAAQWLVLVVFVVFAAATVFGAVVAALSVRIIRGVCGLAMCCVGLSGLYYFLHSPFLALMELLIYVGAVCVTVIFVVMLAEPEEPVQEEPRRHTLVWGTVSLGVAGAIFAGLVKVGFSTQGLRVPATPGNGSVARLGEALLTTYSMAFELISLVLLVAILGALVIARAGRSKP